MVYIYAVMHWEVRIPFTLSSLVNVPKQKEILQRAMSPQIKLQTMLYNMSFVSSVLFCYLKITSTMSGEQHHRPRNALTLVSLH